MSDAAAFHDECKQLARSMRRLPPELRRALASEVKTQIADPLADKMRAHLSGPYAAALSGSIKARVSADPKIVVGGGRRVVSGGAQARDLVFGTEFGGGKKVARVPSRAGRSGYRRRSTNQFVPDHPFVFSTIGANGPWILDTFADIVLKVIDQELDHG